MKKLKIAFLVSKFPTISETFIVNQICDLIDKGHEVRIFSFEKGDGAIIHQDILDYRLQDKTVYFTKQLPSKAKRFFPFFKYLLMNRGNINFKRLIKNFTIIKSGLRGFNLQFFYQYKWILTSYNFDVMHAHFGLNGEYIAGIIYLGFLREKKFVTSFHGYDITPCIVEKDKKIYKNLFRTDAQLTVNSEYTKGLLQKLTHKKIEILPVGLNTLRFQKKYYEAKKRFTILFVGRLVEFKAPDLTIDILHELIKRGWSVVRLIIIGEGTMNEYLEALVSQKDLRPYVQFKGAMTQEEIIAELDKAQVLLMPGIEDITGRSENQGLVLQEAQAMELPVIISDVGGMKYGMIDGLTGFVVKEKDITAFADKIELLLKNEKLRIRMGKAGRQFVVKNFDSRKLGERLEKIYYE